MDKGLAVIIELPSITLFQRKVDGVYGLGKLMKNGKFWGIIVDDPKMLGKLADLADDLKHNPDDYI